jgi:hypothetical protein
MDGPVDIIVDQSVDLVELALVDRAMQRARETPEAVLCHLGSSLNFGSAIPKSGHRFSEKIALN